MRRLIQKAWFYVHDLKANQFTRDHPRYKKYEIGETLSPPETRRGWSNIDLIKRPLKNC